MAPDDIIKLLDRCLSCTYFVYQGEYYLQIHVAAMGSPVSAIVCNLYMEWFEQKALAGAKDPPRWWKRYVDDTHTVLKKALAQEFTEYLNTVDEDIKWTTEGETVKDVVPPGDETDQETRSERTLAFLDTVTVVREDGEIRTRVFRKETHTDQYLNYNSNHPLEHNRGVINTLMHRADKVVSDAEERIKEREHIKSVLEVNGYPSWLFKQQQQISEKRSDGDPNKTNKSDRKPAIVIPYVKGVCVLPLGGLKHQSILNRQTCWDNN